MSVKPRLLLLLGCAVALLAAPAVSRAERPAPPSPEVMKAVHDCAAKQGVELPPPPPPHEKDASGNPPPEGKKAPPPKLTDAQKAIVDACLKENGVTPPQGPPPGAGAPPVK
ncbi:MAG: hypothetical protein HGA90_04180 [Alphaproteobacteria bacterium]|nr:hypothetical protein [Alphaproteobacteria bacterium]